MTEFNISPGNFSKSSFNLQQVLHSRTANSPVVNLPLVAARLIIELNVELLTAFAVACATA